MFLAVAGFAGESRQGPNLGQAGSDPLPQQPQTVIMLQRPSEPEDMSVNQLDPMVNDRRLRRAFAFVHESANGRMERQRFEPGHHGRSGVGDRPLFRRLLIANPTKFPAAPAEGIKGVQGMRRQEAGRTRAANTPAPVNEHLSLPSKTGEKIGGRLFGPDYPRRRHRLHDSHVNDLKRVQGGAFGEICDPWPPFDVQRLHAIHSSAGAVNGDVGRFLHDGIRLRHGPASIAESTGSDERFMGRGGRGFTSCGRVGRIKPGASACEPSLRAKSCGWSRQARSKRAILRAAFRVSDWRCFAAPHAGKLTVNRAWAVSGCVACNRKSNRVCGRNQLHFSPGDLIACKACFTSSPRCASAARLRQCCRQKFCSAGGGW